MNLFRKNSGYILIIVVGLIALFDLTHSGIPITHDGKDQVARIANFYISLSQGNIIPRWAGNLNYGYGHPILMFLYPLPSYIASFFHALSFSFSDAFKLTFVTAFLASGITMYLWIRKMLGWEEGVVSAILYMFAPYRFVDMYVRGDIGEHVAFIFPPLIFYFLLCLKESKKIKEQYFYSVLTSVSLAALILSHNAISIMFIPAILGYMLYLLLQNKDKKLLFFESISFAGGFLFSSFFWIPAFFEGKYTLRDIVTAGDQYKDRFVSVPNLLYGHWSYGISGKFTVQIGILQIMALFLFPVVFYFLHKKYKFLSHLYFLVFLYAISAIFIMLPMSNIVWEKISLLQKFQFPWRFLTVVVFATAVMAGFGVKIIKNKVYKKIIVTFVIILAIVLNFSYYKAQGYFIRSENYYATIYNSTTDTGESSPIWSTRSMDHRFTKPLYILRGSTEITQKKRTFTDHLYYVSVTSNSSKLRENTLYFPGWKLYIDGKKTGFEFQDPNNRGVMTFSVPKGKHTVEFKFKNTKLRTFSEILTAVALAAFILWGGLLFFYKKNYE